MQQADILDYAKRDMGPVDEPARGIPEGKLFEKFLELHQAPASPIFKFAKKWGVLQLCSHELPMVHTYRPSSAFLSWELPCLPTLDERSGYFRESIERWQFFAGYFKAILNIAADLHSERRGHEADWKLILRGHIDPRLEDGPASAVIAARRFLLADIVNWWLEVAAVKQSLEWKSSSPTLQFGTPGLFAHLLLQLALYVGKSAGFAVCSACARTYIPARRPVDDRRNYCQECKRAKVPERDANRNCRQRKKLASLVESTSFLQSPGSVDRNSDFPSGPLGANGTRLFQSPLCVRPNQ